MLLVSRGVTDQATLNVVNRLSDADAIVLAQYLPSLDKKVRGYKLAKDNLLVALAAKPPKPVKVKDAAYIPATSARQYNTFVKESFMNGPENGLLRFALLASETAAIVRSRLGDKGLPDGTELKCLVDSGELRKTIDCAENAVRVTPESLREPLLRLAMKEGARKMLAGLVRDALAAALDPQGNACRLLDGGRFTDSVANFAKGLRLMERFAAWFAQLRANVAGKHPTTTTERLLGSLVSDNAGRAVERFLFEEIAVNDRLALDEENPEAVFGMENNRAMCFIGRNYTSSFSNSLAQIPPERRGLIYDVFDVFDPLPGENDAGQSHRPIDQGGLLVALDGSVKTTPMVVEQ